MGERLFEGYPERPSPDGGNPSARRLATVAAGIFISASRHPVEHLVAEKSPESLSESNVPGRPAELHPRSGCIGLDFEPPVFILTHCLVGEFPRVALIRFCQPV